MSLVSLTRMRFCICNNQYGFRNNHSVTHALIDITQKIRNALDSKYYAWNVKACSSEKLLIPHGVSQGSVLGSLLFLLYINNLHKAVMHCFVHHFADDTKYPTYIYIDKSLKKFKHINQDLKNLCQWIQSNRLSLNTSKTKIIIFRNRLQQINKKRNFRVSGEKINLTSSVKYLI